MRGPRIWKRTRARAASLALLALFWHSLDGYVCCVCVLHTQPTAPLCEWSGGPHKWRVMIPFKCVRVGEPQTREDRVMIVSRSSAHQRIFARGFWDSFETMWLLRGRESLNRTSAKRGTQMVQMSQVRQSKPVRLVTHDARNAIYCTRNAAGAIAQTNARASCIALANVRGLCARLHGRYRTSAQIMGAPLRTENCSRSSPN